MEGCQSLKLPCDVSDVCGWHWKWNGCCGWQMRGTGIWLRSLLCSSLCNLLSRCLPLTLPISSLLIAKCDVAHALTRIGIALPPLARALVDLRVNLWIDPATLHDARPLTIAGVAGCRWLSLAGTVGPM